ncbi:hypothetical protein RI054_03g14150 [Pseudoscourfieldia marina]
MSTAHHPPPNTPLMSAAASGDIQQVSHNKASFCFLAVQPSPSKAAISDAVPWVGTVGGHTILTSIEEEKARVAKAVARAQVKLQGAGSSGAVLPANPTTIFQA